MVWTAIASGASGPAGAQQAGSNATDPSKIEQRIDRPPQRPAPVKELSAPKTPAPAPAEPGQTFILVGADITGSTVYSATDLGALYESYLGRSISLKEVEAITSAITEKYRADGYFLSRAVAPPQDVAFGVLHIRVIEGFVERVEFKGALPGRRALFDGWAAGITAEKPLRLATLERYLLFMADVPGITVRPGLSGLNDEAGSFALEIGIDHRKVDGFLTLDNRGTTAVGPIQSYAGVNLNSVLGLAERTRLAVFTIPLQPKELRYAEIHHEETVTSEGTRVWFLGSRSLVDIGTDGQPSEEDSRGGRLAVGLSQSVVRSREQNLTLNLRFDTLSSIKNSATQVFNDRLRVLRLGVDYNIKDGWGGTSWLTAEVSKGLDILHASDPGATQVSRTDGTSEFVKWTVDVTRQQELNREWAVQLAAAGQVSPNTLLSPEEFAVGGRRFGRAYDPADISGSQGAAGYVELQYNPPLKLPVLTSWQLYGYWDVGAVWGRGFKRDSLASAGGGLRFGLPKGITGRFEVTTPLTRALKPGEEDSDDIRYFFNLVGQF